MVQTNGPDDSEEILGTSKKRHLTGPSYALVLILSSALVLFHVWTTAFGVLPDVMHRAVHLGFSLAIGFLVFKPNPKVSPDRVPWYDLILAGLSAATCIYILFIYRAIIDDPLQWTSAIDFPLGIALVILVLELGRRAVGLIFPFMALSLILYARFGAYFYGRWAHRGFDWESLFQILYHSPVGVWGLLLGISAITLSVFAIFGSCLIQSGAGDVFMNFSQVITRGAKGSPAKVAVISSALFGMISGSAVANVATTGTFTIPAMKKAGYRPAFAGAVEAVASTGGQIMPPIMGAGAFIMSMLIGVPYLKIAAAAVIPAVLYFWGAFLFVHLEAERQELSSGIDMQSKLRIVDVLRLFFPLVLFIGLLVYGFTPPYVAVCSAAMAILLALMTGAVRLYPFHDFFRVLKRIALSSAEIIVEVAVLLASAQIVVTLLGVTGLGVKVSDAIISLAGESVFIALLLTAMVGIILGMGLPSTAAYALGASVLAPAVIKLGYEPMIAHLFVFYYTILSTITPPVCAAVFVAAGIARAPWFETGMIAVRIAAPVYIVGFCFMYSPALLLIGTVSKIVLNSATAFIGTSLVAFAGSGYFFGPLQKWQRIALAGCGIALIKPGIISDTLGLGVALVILAGPFWDRFFRKPAIKSPNPDAPVPDRQ